MSQDHIKPRMHRRIPLKVGLKLAGDFQGDGTIIEMSEGGLSFTSGRAAKSGAHVHLVISDEEGEIKLAGTVVHVTHRSREHVAGVQFADLDGATQNRVKSFLKRHRFSQFRAPVPKA